MIHYHGTPITPKSVAINVLARRHACVSYAHPDQVALAFEACQSVILDNGAFSLWRATCGQRVNVECYAEWVRRWWKHPGFDFCFIPDVIDGSEADNDLMMAEWRGAGMPLLDARCVPVWHMHESFERLHRLCRQYPRVALGSSGKWATPGTADWWDRMGDAMDAICDSEGRPPCKLHGLRMLDPTVFSHLPLASADSCNVARNIGIDAHWRGTYMPANKGDRALILAGRIESHAAAARWNRASRGVQANLQLLG